jgi:CheY-like chemotaxis protein
MLRRVTANDPPRAPLPGNKPARPESGAEKQATILVVEDEVLTRVASSDYLRSCGYRVLEASSGAEAQTLFTSGEPIRLLFTDIELPGEIDGVSLASWVETKHPHVRIIMASEDPDIPERAEERDVGRPLLAKPYAFEVLLFHIRRLIAT